MDLRCVVCGEPWEIDSIHDHVSELHPDKPWIQEDKPETGFTYLTEDGWYNETVYQQHFEKAYNEFKVNGCKFFGCSHNETPIGDVASIRALTDAFGHDMDGLAAMIEDFNL